MQTRHSSANVPHTNRQTDTEGKWMARIVQLRFCLSLEYLFVYLLTVAVTNWLVTNPEPSPFFTRSKDQNLAKSWSSKLLVSFFFVDLELTTFNRSYMAWKITSLENICKRKCRTIESYHKQFNLHWFYIVNFATLSLILQQKSNSRSVCQSSNKDVYRHGFSS